MRDFMCDELDFLRRSTDYRYFCTLMRCTTRNYPCLFKGDSLHTIQCYRAHGCPEPCQVVVNHLRDI